MTLLAERTKTETGRVIPISARLAGILELAKTDPTGEDFKPEDFIFGDSVGREVTDVKKAWEMCLLKAHRHTPKWTQNNSLTPESREAFRAIDLTFHDLRHEPAAVFSRQVGRSTTCRTCLAARTSRRPARTSTPLG